MKTENACTPEELYITYELRQSDGEGEAITIPGVRRLPFRGEVRSWRVGSFEVENGEQLFGVRLTYGRSEPALARAVLQEIIEIPSDAQNVQLHQGTLPRIYDDAFNVAV